MRIISLLLTALMVTGFCGCGNADNSIEKTAPQNSTIAKDQSIEGDMFGTGYAIDAFGKVMAQGGAGLVVSSQTGYMFPIPNFMIVNY